MELGISLGVATFVAGFLIYAIFKISSDKKKANELYPYLLEHYGGYFAYCVKLPKNVSTESSVDKYYYLVFCDNSLKILGNNTQSIREKPYSEFSSYAIEYKDGFTPLLGNIDYKKRLNNARYLSLFTKDSNQEKLAYRFYLLPDEQFNYKAGLQHNLIERLAKTFAEHKPHI